MTFVLLKSKFNHKPVTNKWNTHTLAIPTHCRRRSQRFPPDAWLLFDINISFFEPVFGIIMTMESASRYDKLWSDRVLLKRRWRSGLNMAVYRKGLSRQSCSGILFRQSDRRCSWRLLSRGGENGYVSALICQPCSARSLPVWKVFKTIDSDRLALAEYNTAGT
jgi:hypothetical protein